MTTALVTGANRGIGLELCKLLHERGDDVIAACRESSSDLDGLGVRVETGADITSAEAMGSLARRVGTDALDLLVCNAGLLERNALDDLDFESIRRQFEVNAIGPLRTVASLRSCLRRDAKIGLITSRMGSIGDNTSGGGYGYRMSKVALNMAGVSLSQDLASDGIAVAILHPGFVRTGMTGYNGHVEPAEAARGLLARLDELTPATSGGFWHANGERLPW